MGFDVLFKHSRPVHHNNHDYGGHRDVYQGHHGGLERYLYFFEKLKSNKKLLIALFVAAIVLIILVIAVIIMLIPPIIKWLETIQISGISGLVKAARPLLELLWSGTGK